MESALRQDCDSWEVLVLHTDAPALEEPSDAGPAPDERVRHLHLGAGTTSDAAVALEAGRTAAHGEMVGVLAAGDELEPGALAAALMVLDADPALDLVYTDEQWPAPGAEGIVTHLQRAIVIGPIARLELMPVEGDKQSGAASGDALIEAQMPAQQYKDMGLREGDMLVVTPRKARVFVGT